MKKIKGSSLMERTTQVVYKIANEKVEPKIPNKTPKISQNKIFFNTKSKTSLKHVQHKNAFKRFFFFSFCFFLKKMKYECLSVSLLDEVIAKAADSKKSRH